MFDITVVLEKIPTFRGIATILASLVEHAGNFSMLHPCMHSKFFINIENTESTHGEILRKEKIDLQPKTFEQFLIARKFKHFFREKMRKKAKKADLRPFKF